MVNVSDLAVVALVGSLRRGSAIRAIANTLDELAPDEMHITLLSSPGRISQYKGDIVMVSFPTEVSEMGREIEAADGVVIVTPEYHHALPSTLITTLDWLARLPTKPLAGKAVALQSASRQSSGGRQAQAQLRNVLKAVGSRVLEGSPIEIAEVGRKVDLETDSLVEAEARSAISQQLSRLAAFIGEINRPDR